MKRLKVLVIDDEEDARKLLCRRLLANQIDAIAAADGITGLELAKKEKPDLVLLDIMMPEMDGLQCYQALREDPATKDVPGIFITALCQGETMDRHSLELIAQAKHGVELDDNYLIVGKPYEPEVLIAAIHSLVNKK